MCAAFYSRDGVRAGMLIFINLTRFDLFVLPGHSTIRLPSDVVIKIALQYNTGIYKGSSRLLSVSL